MHSITWRTRGNKIGLWFQYGGCASVRVRMLGNLDKAMIFLKLIPRMINDFFLIIFLKLECYALDISTFPNNLHNCWFNFSIFVMNQMDCVTYVYWNAFSFFYFIIFQRFSMNCKIKDVRDEYKKSFSIV